MLSGNSGSSLHEPRGETKYSTPFPQPPLFHVFQLDTKVSNNLNGSQDYKSKNLLLGTSKTQYPCQETQPRLQTLLELQPPIWARGNLKGISPCAKVVSPSLRAAHEPCMPFSRTLLLPTEMGTLSSWWPAVGLYQLLPRCWALPSHSQPVWGITLQKRKHIDLTVHWGTRLLCSLENMTYKGWLKELGCLV